MTGNSNRNTTCCGCYPSSKKIFPLPEYYSDSSYFEVRPGRLLHLVHHNATDKFDADRKVLSACKRQDSERMNDSSSNGALKSPYGSPSHSSKNHESYFFDSPLKHLPCRGSEDCVIFFIHGVGGCSDVWKLQIDYFASLGYGVVAPDLIGHGFSCTPRDPDAYHFNAISADMLAIFDKFRKKKNIVIGHSYGSSFATYLSRQRSNYVSRLILMSGGSPTALAPQPGIFSFPLCVLGCFRPIMMCGFRRSAFKKKTMTPAERMRSFDIPTYVLRSIMRGQVWSEGDEAYHKLIKTPTLLIYGLQDPLVSFEEEEEMKMAIEGCKMEVIDQASHMVMMEHSELVAAIIHEFILPDPTISPVSSPSKYKLKRRKRSSQSARSRSKSLPDSSNLIRTTIGR